MDMQAPTRTGWPDHFNLENDDLFDRLIKPFIEAKMADLAALDLARQAWVAENLPAGYHMNYIFHEHALRVAGDLRATALHMGLAGRVVDNLYWAMLPHDIGKAALPVSLWDRVEKPDEATKALRRSHTVLGADMMDEARLPPHPFTDLMRDIMLNHHEQMDGQGFRGLTGDQLSLPVRLACIVESYDGYTIARPHFGARDISAQGVIDRMRSEKGAALYDMDLFEAFADMKLAGPGPAASPSRSRICSPSKP